MSTEPIQSSIGTRFITALAVTAASALLLVIAPSPAHAAGDRSSHVLKQGVGMVEHPSVRVRALQRTLARRGYTLGRFGADGRFGPRTARAVRRFQRAHHLRVDGIVGSRTRATLRRSARSVTRRADRTHHIATKASAPAAVQSPPTFPVALPAPVVPSSGQPQPAPLSVDSGPSWWRSPLLLGLLAALGVAFGAVALARYERRARVATYRRSRRTDPDPRLDPPDRVHAAASPPEVSSPPRTAESVGVASASTSPAAVGRHAAHSHVIGYVPVPANLRASDMTASERTIERVCQRGGWQLLDIVHDAEGTSLDEHSGISRALGRIAAGEASALVVSDARLLGRSLDLAEVLRRLDDAEAALVAVDLGLDTSTPQGRRVASALVTMSGWGRQRRAVTLAGGRSAVRGSARWADGRLRIDGDPAATATHNGNGMPIHEHTGNGAAAHNGNGAAAHNGNGAAAHNGNGAAAHNGNGARTHHGNGATNGNGNGAAVHNGTVPSEPAMEAITD